MAVTQIVFLFIFVTFPQSKYIQILIRSLLGPKIYSEHIHIFVWAILCITSPSQAPPSVGPGTPLPTAAIGPEGGGALAALPPPPSPSLTPPPPSLPPPWTLATRPWNTGTTDTTRRSGDSSRTHYGQTRIQPMQLFTAGFLIDSLLF